MNNLNKFFTKGKNVSEQLLDKYKQTSSVLVANTRSKGAEVKKFVGTPMKTHLQNSVKFVDETLGVSQVTEAQHHVSSQEKIFLNARDDVQMVKASMDEKQDFLNETRKKLDRCDRTDEKYLSFVTEEHALLLEVKKLQRDYEAAEDDERQKFLLYSSAVRLAHEKERSNTERTKYWSIIGSVTGTIIGFTFSSLLTQYRLTRMKEITTDAIATATTSVRRDIDAQGESLIEKMTTLHDSIYSSKGQSDVSLENVNKLIEDVLKELETIESNAGTFSDGHAVDIAELKSMLRQLAKLNLNSIVLTEPKIEKDKAKEIEVLSSELLEKLQERDQRVMKTLEQSQLTFMRNFDQKLIDSAKDIAGSRNNEPGLLTRVENIPPPSHGSLSRFISAENINLVVSVTTLAVVLLSVFAVPGIR